MDASPLLTLAETWEEEADLLRRRGLEREATMEESLAEELREAVAEWKLEALTVAEASSETGYSESHLRALLSEGKLENVGREGAPRLRRGDLPAKPGSNGTGSTARTLADEALERRT